MSNINLQDYFITYNITCLPVILYSKLILAEDYLKFDSFYIPPELESSLIECNFCLYNKEGDLVEFSNNVVSNLNIISTLNNIPLKMIKNLLLKNKESE